MKYTDLDLQICADVLEARRQAIDCRLQIETHRRETTGRRTMTDYDFNDYGRRRAALGHELDLIYEEIAFKQEFDEMHAPKRRRDARGRFTKR